MGSLAPTFEARLVPGTLCACATILVYDLFCTLDAEITYVWPRPWSISTVLFVLNRYLPFVDTFLSLSSKFTRLTPEECLARNKAVAWLSFLGIFFSEGILMLRTYAIWERKKSVAIFLSGLAVVVFVPSLVFVYIETTTLHYVSSGPDVLGCTLGHAGTIAIFAYMLFMISETTIAVLTAVKAYRDLRRSRVPWVVKLYKDGLVFYLYLLAISIANVLVPILAPSSFSNWLATPQRVLHSVLCSRVLLLILRRRNVSTSEVVPLTAISETDTTGVFSTVVDDTTANSNIDLTTFDSTSRREVYPYPASPGAGDLEENGSSFKCLSRVFFIAAFAFVVRWFFFSSSSASATRYGSHQIKEHNFIERATRPDKSLNVQKHPFLQARMGRDERDELMGTEIRNGEQDYWERFQMPYMMSKDTSSMDAQHVVGAIDQLLSLNGWVAALCPTLTRPFGQNKHEHAYDDLVREDHLYFIAIVIHSADHFLVDQLAVIVQMAKRLGTNNLFVSMLDYESSDSTETLTDLCEAVLTLLGVPFRIRRVPGMTADPAAAYYPLEEAHMRNLALEPLHELRKKRGINFHRVIWLKGFTCPNDIFETIKVSFVNEAAMVCGMDWAEHNGFFIFSDRWRTRDIDGDQFRQSKSSSKAEAVPPRDHLGASRYAQHLPFQVFCCESGTHVVDPAQSYYKDIAYRAGTDYHNLSRAEAVPNRDPDAACLDSSQAWFCRDLWVRSARDSMDEVDKVNNHDSDHRVHRRAAVAEREPLAEPEAAPQIEAAAGQAQAAAGRRPAAGPAVDADANAGSDYDAMPEDDSEGTAEEPPFVESDPVHLSMPNSVFRPARILVNPRCVTTYAGVSHTQLALDLFGTGEGDTSQAGVGKYVLEDWEGAPESFVCQEQRQTGGRKATKTQRRLGFSIHDELQR
ncbi:glycosyltransferase family 69 protein [Favolaschia claudopus]|uniref:Glycosyltransferase family 69 protein n=1 Tax=Favolaschia claudopus TaxID=2862362 RepID=A0AAW0B0I6_9AGAR